MNNLLYSLASVCFCIVIGGAVYEHMIVVPEWSAAPPLSLSMFEGKYGLKPESFWKLVHPVTTLLLGASIILNRKTARRNHLLLVFTFYLVILAITAIYFVPELLSITSTPFSSSIDAELTARAKTWELLSLIRLAVLLCLAIYLLLGLAKSETTGDAKKRTINKLQREAAYDA